MIAAGRTLASAPGVVRTGCTPIALASLFLVALGVGPVAAQTEVVEYYGQDALGSIRIVFDVSGVATARADFEPFGELFTVPGMPGGQLPAQQFTAQERDPEASQDYFGARFYTPRTGRFSQGDPVYAGLFDPQQWNRYAYVRNNPLTFVDPDGRDTVSSNCYYDEGLNMEMCHVVGQDLSPKRPPPPTSNFDGWYFPDWGAVGSFLEGFMPEVTTGDQVFFQVAGANLVVGAAGAVTFVAGPTVATVVTSTTLSNAPAVTAAVGAAGGATIGASGGLPAGRQVAASWSASVYNRGGLMTGIEHIMYRHGYNSGWQNVSKFAQGTSARDVAGYVDSALKIRQRLGYWAVRHRLQHWSSDRNDCRRGDNVMDSSLCEGRCHSIRVSILVTSQSRMAGCR